MHWVRLTLNPCWVRDAIQQPEVGRTDCVPFASEPRGMFVCKFAM